MLRLSQLFGDPEKSEFVIVTIATEMAVKESVRLFEELKNGEVRVKVENVVVNQVAVEGGESGMDRIRGGQKKILDKFDEFAKEWSQYAEYKREMDSRELRQQLMNCMIGPM